MQKQTFKVEQRNILHAKSTTHMVEANTARGASNIVSREYFDTFTKNRVYSQNAQGEWVLVYETKVN